MPTCKRCHRQTVTITGNPISAAVFCEQCARHNMKQLKVNINPKRGGMTDLHHTRVRALFGYMVDTNRDIHNQDIRRILDVDKDCAHGLIAGLKKKGLVKVTCSEPRNYSYFITDAGRHFYNQIKKEAAV